MFKKVKNWLGIEGVKLSFVEGSVSKAEENSIVGKIRLTSQSDQAIEKIKISIKEKYSRGRRKSKLVDEYLIAQKEIVLGQQLLASEKLDIDFDINYDLIKSEIDKFGQRNIFYRGLSKIAKLAKNVKSNYTVIAEAYVIGNALKPYDKVDIEL